jgi:hypothetical protein
MLFVIHVQRITYYGLKVFQQKENIMLSEFKSLSEYDIILSDVNLRYCNIASMKNFLEKDVKQEGKV